MKTTYWATGIIGFSVLLLLCLLSAYLYSVSDSLALHAQTDAAPVTVTGQVVFDTGGPVQGARVTAALVPIVLPPATGQAFLPLIRNNGGDLSAAGRNQGGNETTTDANGNFTLVVDPQQPSRVLLEVRFESASMPAVQTAKWGDLQGNQLDMGTIVIPNPQGAEMTLTNGAGQNADGSVQVSAVSTDVNRLFGRAYDPDVNIDAFPGEFAEGTQIPLNSSVFVWMEALDANGNPVDTLANAARIRSRVPRTQWIDLEDIASGTDRIDVPIYAFDETTQLWEQMGVGWLEDGVGTILPEDAQSVILSGAFVGDIYSVFETTHFSWMNVDYPYIGPWTLSRLDRDRRNNDCLYEAMQLAKRIALSTVGRQAYAKVNQPGADLGVELSDGNGPELKNDALDWTNDSQTNGEYSGDAGGREDEFALNNQIWSLCDQAGKRKDTILLLASTILHESAHWKDDVKKHPADDTDTPGEEGKQLEKDIFGGDLHYDPVDGRLERDGNPVDEATKDGWLNHNNWPPPNANAIVSQVEARTAQGPSPLQITLSVTKTQFAAGEPLTVEVTYTNVSTAPLRLLDEVLLEDYPLRFDIIHTATGERVNFLGPELDRGFGDDAFVTLNPGETLVKLVNLTRDEAGAFNRYNLRRSGDYEIQAVYSPFFGLPETESNSLVFTLTPGGRVSGIVTNATTGQPVSGASVSAIQNSDPLDVVTTGVDGLYALPDLPTDIYTVTASAPGFLRNIQPSVQVTAGQTTTVNFNLSPLLAQGELRMVLSWGEAPRDLDSHLWLPATVPYHIDYRQRGNFTQCPFAGLDVDDTDGFGPETTTIKQRYNTGAYLYAIYNYSGSPAFTESQAQVQIFDATGLIATFTVPGEGAGRWWHVLNVDGATGGITEVNQIVEASPEPYTASTGCNPALLDVADPKGAEE